MGSHGCAPAGRARARKAPPGLAERLEEEWLADLTARQGAFARIRFGLGCCWATRVIAREFGVAAAAAHGPASGQHVLVGYGGYDFSRVSRRTIAMIAIACLHVGVFYLYLTGFTRPLAPNRTDPMDGRFIDRRRPDLGSAENAAAATHYHAGCHRHRSTAGPDIQTSPGAEAITVARSLQTNGPTVPAAGSRAGPAPDRRAGRGLPRYGRLLSIGRAASG